ncbi:MAG: hypothetical protein WDO12_11620 [Pseudomonadota bacterium]
MDSGKHAIDSTSRLLKRLDLSSLSLLEEGEKGDDRQAQGAAQKGQKKDPDATDDKLQFESGGKGSGFNPYDTRMPPKRGAVAPAKPGPPAKPRITQPVMPVKQKKRGFFARLFGSGGR